MTQAPQAQQVSELFIALHSIDAKAHWDLIRLVPAEALQNPSHSWWQEQGEDVARRLIEKLKMECPPGHVFEYRENHYGFWKVDET